MSTDKNTGLETLTLAGGTSGFGSEIQLSIGRWLAQQYEVPSDIPGRLAALLEQLMEPTTGSDEPQGSATAPAQS